MSDTQQTCVTCVWDHDHWFPHEILTCLQVKHFSEAQSGQILYQNEKNVSDTCRTRDRHVSRVWDHDHWIPGKILTCIHVNNFSVAHLEPELGFKPTKKKRGALKKKLRGFEKN